MDVLKAQLNNLFTVLFLCGAVTLVRLFIFTNCISARKLLLQNMWQILKYHMTSAE
jgi:hypothetical protein